MRMLISLEIQDNDYIYINPDHIVSIQPRYEGECTVSMADGNSIVVKKTAERTFNEIRRAKK